MDKREISVGINVAAKIENAQKNIISLQNQLNKLNVPASVKNEFEGLFSGMERELEKLTQKTAGGKLKLIDRASVEKSVENIDSLYGALIKKFESRGIATAGLKEDQRAISAINVAMKSYSSATKGLVADQNKLNNAIIKQEQAKAEALEKQKQQKLVSEQELAVQKDRVKAAQDFKKAKKEELDFARANLNKKIQESGGKYTEADITKKNSNLRKTDAYRAYAKASLAADQADERITNEKKTLAGMSTLSLQKQELAEIDERIKTARASLQSFNETQKAAKEQNAFETIKKSLENLEGVDFSKYGIDLNEIKSIEDLEKALQKVTTVVNKNATAAGEQFAQQMKETGVIVDQTTEEILECANATKELDDRQHKMDAAQSRIKQFLGVAGATQLMRRAIRDAISTIKELDATMTEMAVVTDLSVGDYWDQLPEYSKQASELGVSINSAYEAATLYYQQGLKSNEVTKIASQTLKMAKIAGLSAADATDKMTAALRGFNMELNETSAERVADVYSKLAAITAADVNEISSAMSKTASIASSAGMEFETTAAFLAQIVETTRESAETAGTALKTVIARFQELKKDPSEIGEVDGEIVDANKIETALRSVGVALRDSSGQFRDLDDVFMELSQKWNTLDTNTQRYIATIAAGSRQQSRFIAMMSDYARTQELVAEANNSAGASSAQFDKTLESLQSKLEKLKNAWHEFSMGILESDLVKVGVEILTKFLEIVNKATSTLGSFGNALTKVFSVFAFFKLGQKLFDKFKTPLLRFFVDVADESYKGGVNAMKAYKKGVEDEKNNTAKITESKKPKRPTPDPAIKNMGIGERFTYANQKRKENKNLRNIINEKKQNIKAGEANYKATQAGLIGKQGQLAGYEKEAVTAAQERENYLKNNPNIQKKKGKYVAKKGKTLTKEQQDSLKSFDTREKEAKNNAGAVANEINKDKEALAKYEAERDDLANKEEEYKQNSVNAWDAVGQSIGEVGSGVASVGAIFSMLGGVLQTLGLEELGEGLSSIGQIITIIGMALMAIPPILTLITSHPIIALITLILAVIMGTIIAIVSHLNSLSAEAKLEKAKENLKSAQTAADDAAESYDKLKTGLDELDNKYNTLDKLTRGTEEWNAAVQDINKSVLDLIDEYPELARFVENKEGVLTIDMESEGVQQVLDDAQTRKITAAATATSAAAAVDAAQLTADFSNLEAVNKVANKRGWQAFGETTMGIAGGTTAAMGVDPFSALLTGATVGLFSGLNKKAETKTDQDLQKAVSSLGQAAIDGSVELNYDSMLAYLKDPANGFNLLAGEAEMLAEQFAMDTDALVEFGAAANAAEASQKAAFDAIAASAHQMVDTTGLSQEEILQSQVMVDGDVTKAYYDEMMNQMGDVDFDDKNLDDANKARLNEAIRAQYGSTAKYEDGKIKYEKDGETVELEMDNEGLKNLIATQYATEQTSVAAQYTDDAIRRMQQIASGNTGTIKGYSKEGGADATQAIDSFFKASNGQALTQAELTTLQGMKDENYFKTMWDSLGDQERLAFGDSYEVFISKFNKGVEAATNSFKKAQDSLEEIGFTAKQAAEKIKEYGYMTAEQAQSWTNKLLKVSEKAGGQEAVQAVENARETLLASFSDTKKSEIQNLINSTDWTNLEDLLALQIDLQQEYGIGEQEAKAFTAALANANYATSSLTTTILKFGDLYQSQENLAKSTDRLAVLQDKLNNAYKIGIQNTKDLIQQILNEYKNQAAEQENIFNNAQNNLAKLWGQAADASRFGVDLTQYLTIDEDGKLNESKLEELEASGKLNIEETQEWLRQYKEQLGIQNDSLKGILEARDAVLELETTLKESYDSLTDMAREVMLDQMQKQIDLQQELLDATNTANEQLINKIQEQIDDARQARENEETEKDIGDLRSQLIYKMMDTSGTNDLELLDLEEQIKQEEQAYQDSLVDQYIESIAKNNEKAAEQREKQIQIAQKQLDEYTNSKEFSEAVEREVNSMVNGEVNWKDTPLGEALTKHFTDSLTSKQQESWLADIDGMVANAKNFLNGAGDSAFSNTATHIQGIYENLLNKFTEQGETVASLGDSKRLQNTASSVESKGFNLESMGITVGTGESGKTEYSVKSGEEGETSKEKLAAADRMIKSSNSSRVSEYQNTIASKITSVNKGYQDGQSKIDKLSEFEYMSEREFYGQAQLDADGNYYVSVTKNGVETKYYSYEDYLASIAGRETGLNNLNPYEAFGGTSVPADATYLKNVWGESWKSGIDFNLVVNGVPDNEVELGSQVQGQTLKKALDYIWKTTGEKGDIVYLNGSTAENGVPDYGQHWEDKIYLRQGAGLWWKVRDYGAKTDDGTDRPKNLTDAGRLYMNSLNNERKYERYLPEYKTGGLADFTGPAWLDGTKSKPEIILNQKDSANFIVLRDILSEILGGASSISNSNTQNSSGDNHFEIEINVEKLENDYDVEKLANKIRSMIYEDASYRNVNAVGIIR